MQPTSEAAGRQSGPPRSALVNIYLYTFILERSAGSIPIPAHSAPLSRFSAISPPLDLVSSRGLRPAIDLSREGFARVRVRCRRGRTRSASEVARSRLRGLPHVLQSQPYFDSPVSRLRGLPHAPQSQPRFFTTTSVSGSSYSLAVTLFFFGLFLV